MTGNTVREEGMTCSEGLQVGFEPSVAAARTEPLYVGGTLCQLSYLVSDSVFLCVYFVVCTHYVFGLVYTSAFYSNLFYFVLFCSILFYSILFLSMHCPSLRSSEAFSYTPNLTTCHWVINIQMTCSYPVIGALKCHQMLRNHHLQISNSASSGK